MRALFRPAQEVTIVLSNSGDGKSLAHSGWYIYVSSLQYPVSREQGFT